MSLYSGIAVPKEARQPVKRPGFAGLYDEPPLVTPAETTEVLSSELVNEEKEDETNKPNAALQFAPNRRRRSPVIRRQVSDPRDVVAHAPRLEVTNAFEDYAQFQPELPPPLPREKRKRRRHEPEPEITSWDDDYDPTRPIDFRDYRDSDVRLQEREAYKEHVRLRERVSITPRNSPPRASFNQGHNTQLQTHAELVERPQNEASRPSATTFAQRYMASHGWKKGQGLGASNAGRLGPLFIKPSKGGLGRIIDRHKPQELKKTSRVIVIDGLVDLMPNEMLQQEIGDQCTASYGNVERVKVVKDAGRVFVRFVDGLSALRCINNAATEFNGRQVTLRHYDEDAFEMDVWDK